MKALFVTILFVGLSAMSCSKEKPQNTPPADYAETYDDLIQNPEKDSAATDSSDAVSGEPARQDSAIKPQ